ASRMGNGPSFHTARKLHGLRDQKWHNKWHKKVPLGTALGANTFGGASRAKGIVLGKAGFEAQQPHSAIRKHVRIQLIKNGKKVADFVPKYGGLNFTEGNDEVLVDGFGHKGHAAGDVPGVRFKAVKVADVSLLPNTKAKKKKKKK
uniref:Small ribosomal subunit protein uS12 n=1 Tax=Mustela putorius furo TaxID=9669 RepID=M3YPR1_MUSPF